MIHIDINQLSSQMLASRGFKQQDNNQQLKHSNESSE